MSTLGKVPHVSPTCWSPSSSWSSPASTANGAPRTTPPSATSWSSPAASTKRTQPRPPRRANRPEAPTGVLTEVFKGAEGGPDSAAGTVETVMEEPKRVRGKVARTSAVPRKGAGSERTSSAVTCSLRPATRRARPLRGIVEKEDGPAAIAELDKRFGDVKVCTTRRKGASSWSATPPPSCLSEPQLRDAWLSAVRVVLGIDRSRTGWSVRPTPWRSSPPTSRRRSSSTRACFSSEYRSGSGA